MTERQTALLPRQRAPTLGGDAKRDRILKIAERLFFEQGYDRTSMDQIVAELGVTKPYVYYYFHNKQQILETLSWPPAVEALTSMDFEPDDPRPAHVKVGVGLEKLIRSTIANHPSAFFAYLEPQAYRPDYKAAQKRLLDHFYAKLYALLEAGRDEGMLDFNETSVTALAACSLPGFLHTWYRPGGRLSTEEMVSELSMLALRVVGLRKTPKRAARP